MSKYWKNVFALIDAFGAPYREEMTTRIITDPEEAARLEVPVGYTVQERAPAKFKVFPIK